MWTTQINSVKIFLMNFKEFLKDLFFPRFCIGCGQEGTHLCQDCQSLIEILDRQYCPFCSQAKVVFDGKTCPLCRKSKHLSGLFFATSYQNPLVKKMISLFKYHFIKELSQPLASLIITHFQILSKAPNFLDKEKKKEFILIPIPLHKKQLKTRGFNQAEELAKEISSFLEIPLINNTLLKIKETLPQVKLGREKRKENIKGAFFLKNPHLIKGKRILLIDDVFTTGSTIEEAACLLKKAGAKEVWGVTVAREEIKSEK
ncbi:ComF family protein [bacterium]|nr:ComF family protein [bacterium]